MIVRTSFGDLSEIESSPTSTLPLVPNLGTRLPDGLDRTFLQARDTQAATTVLALVYPVGTYKHHLLLARLLGSPQ